MLAEACFNCNKRRLSLLPVVDACSLQEDWWYWRFCVHGLSNPCLSDPSLKSKPCLGLKKYGRAQGTKDDVVQKGSNRGQPALAAACQEVRTGQPGWVLTVSEYRI